MQSIISYEYLIYYDCCFGLCKLATMRLSGWHPACVVDNTKTLDLEDQHCQQTLLIFFMGFLVMQLISDEYLSLLLWLFWPVQAAYNESFRVTSPRLVSNTNTIYLRDQHCKQTVLAFFMVHLSHFLFLKSFWEFKLPCLFFCYYYHYLC